MTTNLIGDREVKFPYLLLEPYEVFGFYGQKVGTDLFRLHNGLEVRANKYKIRPGVEKKGKVFVEIDLEKVKPGKGISNPDKYW